MSFFDLLTIIQSILQSTFTSTSITATKSYVYMSNKLETNLLIA